MMQQQARHRRAAADEEHRGARYPSDFPDLFDLGEECSCLLSVFSQFAANCIHAFVLS
jgi:hypothetical protein